MEIPEFIANTPDGQRCMQATYRMTVHALTGVQPTAAEAEEETGFVAGRPTWQFTMMLGFAARGIRVNDWERFDPLDFLRDPVSSIERQVGDPAIAQQVLDESDIDHEVAALTKCLESPLISFTDRVATTADLQREMSDETLLLCNVNARRLMGEPGRVGHFVIVQSINDDSVIVTDPGLPPVNRHEIPTPRFNEAWGDPSPDMANFISARLA